MQPMTKVSKLTSLLEQIGFNLSDLGTAREIEQSLAFNSELIINAVSEVIKIIKDDESLAVFKAHYPKKLDEAQALKILKINLIRCNIIVQLINENRKKEGLTNLSESEKNEITNIILNKLMNFKGFMPYDDAPARIYFEVLQRRLIGAPDVQKTLNEAEDTIDPDTLKALSAGFEQLSSEFMVDWLEYQDKMQPYHRVGHGMEMRQNAIEKLNIAAKRLFPDKPLIQALYIQIGAAAHAIHDLIQLPGPPKNEYDSYLKFMEKVNNLREINKEKAQYEALLKAIDHLGYEIIVNGTVFDFGENRFVGEHLFESLKQSSHLPKTDPATTCAVGISGINDTSRSTQFSDTAGEELTRQRQYCGDAPPSDENLFIAFLKEKYPGVKDKNRITGPIHMLGQNIRMRSEILLNMGDTDGLASFMLLLLYRAGECFTQEQRQALLAEIEKLPEEEIHKYFEKWLEILEKEEHPFAKKFDGKTIIDISFVIEDALKDLPKTHPEDESKEQAEREIVIKTDNPHAWKNYAGDLGDPNNPEEQGFLKKYKNIKDVALKRKFLCDLALIAGHQVGAEQALNDKVYQKILEERCEKFVKFKNLSDLDMEQYVLAYKYLDEGTRNLRQMKNFGKFDSKKIDEKILRYEEAKDKILQRILDKWPIQKQIDEFEKEVIAYRTKKNDEKLPLSPALNEKHIKIQWLIFQVIFHYSRKRNEILANHKVSQALLDIHRGLLNRLTAIKRETKLDIMGPFTPKPQVPGYEKTHDLSKAHEPEKPKSSSPRPNDKS